MQSASLICLPVFGRRKKELTSCSSAGSGRFLCCSCRTLRVLWLERRWFDAEKLTKNNTMKVGAMLFHVISGSLCGRGAVERRVDMIDKRFFRETRRFCLE